MGAKKTSTWRHAIINLLLVVPSVLNLASNFVSYLEYEARLAKKSIITLIILFGLAIVLSLSSWACLWIIIFLSLINYLSVMITMAIIFIIHMVLLVIVMLWISKTKNNLLFTNTRQLFH